MDLMTKFNRGMILALAEKNIYEAVQMFRQYCSYLNESGEKEELTAARSAFFAKLLNYTLENDALENLIPAYQELLAAYPKDPILYRKAARCFERLGQYDIEFELLKKAVEFNNENDIGLLRATVDAAKKINKIELGIDYAEKLCAINPDEQGNFSILSLAYYAKYNITGQEACLDKAIQNAEIAFKMNSNEKAALRNLIVLYTNKPEKEKLKAAWGKYMQFPNLTYEDKFNYGTYLISCGDFENGLKYYEARILNKNKLNPYPQIDKPQYTGAQNIKEKTLLIRWEQGFGDIFLFLRFLNDLKARAKKIIFMVPKPLYSVVKRNFPDIETVCDDIPLKSLNFDYHLPMMSVLKIFGVTKNNIPNNCAYIVPDKEKAARFKKEIFNTDKFKIGVVFEGNIVGLQTRNIPLLELLPLTKINGAQVYSLQFGASDKIFENTGIINLSSHIKDFDDTLSLIENLDLLVTVDASVMNAAGAIGKRAFCLFNYIPEYRWFDLSGENVKWYSSVKPYQAKAYNGWAEVVSRVVKDIKEVLK